MSNVKLEFPVLVQQHTEGGQPLYHLRPIFLPDSIVRNRRFENAMSNLKTLVARRLQGLELNRSNSEYLLWHLFNPKLAFHCEHFQFKVGKAFFDGTIAFVTFELKGITFVCLPTFNHFIFILSTDTTKKVPILSKVKSVAVQLIKEMKQSNPDLECSNFYVTKRAFITTVERNVRIKSGLFHFEQDRSNFFFNSLQKNDDFDGGTEIEKVGKDLTELYPNDLLRAFYRESLVKRLSTIIYQQENAPLVIIGKEGVGKHSLIHEVTYQYVEKYQEKDRNALPKTWLIDPTRIISGMMYVGWWEKRLETILEFIRTRRKHFFEPKQSDKIVFDNVIALLRVGKSAGSNMTLGDVLRPYIEKRQLQVILIASPEEWKVVQEKDRRFSDLFQVIRIEEPDLEDAIKMILSQRRLLELEYECDISIQTLHFLFNIHRNYLRDKALPGSVSKLLKQLAVKYRSSSINMEDAREEFKDFSGLEEAIFDTSVKLEKEQVKKTIAAQLVGQPQAVDALANVVHTIKAKLSNPNKPLASFLFIGPTGVGKTQAAKVLSHYLMGNEKHLIRFDMNEYIDAGATHRLIGDYTNPEGQLTGKVRYHPFGVLLLDEIEKAHPSVHDLLLQVLDDGRLTDSVGRTVYFTNLIIIMTSNVGAREVASHISMGSNQQEEGAIFRKAVENTFRPEFVNRIDQIIIFKPLQYEHILNIARLQIKELLQRDGFVRRSTILNISQEALSWVAKRGFDARMGGRALKRQIEKDLTSLSADQLIATKGNQPILFDITFKEGRLIPMINELEVARRLKNNWMPKLPDEKQGKRFYGNLLRRIEKIEKEISRVALPDQIITQGVATESDNWRHFYFKKRLAEVKDHIQLMVAGFRDRYFQGPIINSLRLKRLQSVFAARTERKQKAIMHDHFFQQKAIEDLTEAARYAPMLFDKVETQFINDFLDVFFLECGVDGFLDQQSDQLILQLESAVSNMGKEEIQLLLEQYEAIFKLLDLPYTTNKKLQQIAVEGFGLYEILKGEEGIHLFRGINDALLPVKVFLRSEQTTLKSFNLNKVIRMYKAGNILYDLRTEISNVMPITPQEMKLLLYGGMVDK